MLSLSFQVVHVIIQINVHLIYISYSLTVEPLKPKMLAMIEDGEKVIYSCNVTKYDRHGYHPRDRVIAVTPKSTYLFDVKDGKLKQKISHDMLNGEKMLL